MGGILLLLLGWGGNVINICKVGRSLDGPERKRVYQSRQTDIMDRERGRKKG